MTALLSDGASQCHETERWRDSGLYLCLKFLYLEILVTMSIPIGPSADTVLCPAPKAGGYIHPRSSSTRDSGDEDEAERKYSHSKDINRSGSGSESEDDDGDETESEDENRKQLLATLERCLRQQRYTEREIEELSAPAAEAEKILLSAGFPLKLIRETFNWPLRLPESHSTEQQNSVPSSQSGGSSVSTQACSNGPALSESFPPAFAAVKQASGIYSDVWAGIGSVFPNSTGPSRNGDAILTTLAGQTLAQDSGFIVPAAFAMGGALTITLLRLFAVERKLIDIQRQQLDLDRKDKERLQRETELRAEEIKLKKREVRLDELRFELETKAKKDEACSEQITEWLECKKKDGDQKLEEAKRRLQAGELKIQEGERRLAESDRSLEQVRNEQANLQQTISEAVKCATRNVQLKLVSLVNKSEATQSHLKQESYRADFAEARCKQLECQIQKPLARLDANGKQNCASEAE